MSAPIQFTPRHAQPFTLEEAMELEVETLVAEINRLRNSISHLRRTQAELQDYLSSEEGRADEDERKGQGEVSKAVRENDGVIQSQTERIALITVALSNKLGGDARLEHYGLTSGGDEGRSDPNPKHGSGAPAGTDDVPTAGSGAGEADGDGDGDGDGLHL